MKVHITGKISTDSVFGTHYWRYSFLVQTKKHFGKLVKNYRNPFVSASCDIVCRTIDKVADALKVVKDIRPKTLNIINASIEHYLDSKNIRKRSSNGVI